MDNINENQHYVSKVLLERFRLPNSPLQRFRVDTSQWTPKNPRNVCSTRGWNQLRVSGTADNSLEAAFSKVESDLPDVLAALEDAASRPSTELHSNIYHNMCLYCAFLWHTSPFAKATAVLNFISQIELDFRRGKSDPLVELGFSQDSIEGFRNAVAQGQRIILHSKEPLQLVYRIQLNQSIPWTYRMFRGTVEWTIFNSPVELPISDIALVQLRLISEKVVFYVLPIGPKLLLSGKISEGPQSSFLRKDIRGATLSQEAADYWLQAICLSPLRELVASRQIPDILSIRTRAAKNGIAYPRIVDPSLLLAAGMSELKNPLGLKAVSAPEYVKFVHSMLQPAPEASASDVPDPFAE